MEPVHKVDQRDHVEKCHPISLLCVMSKELECCVLNHIKECINDLISSCQHGRVSECKSCVTNLLKTLDHINSLLYNCSQIDAIYLDMSKGFAKVRHDLLIDTLQEGGIDGNLLRLFTVYFSGQQQCVTILD